MTFLFASALVALALVGAPYFAHRLRRRSAEMRLFAAAHLVPPAPPRARRRSVLEDKSLFGIRALAVVALALLGASPFVRCSRLSLARSSGASVALALVLDDSMSMQAKLGDETRFERAKRGARELLASAREGDAVAIVLAGSPPRVALAPTSDLGSARASLDALHESDRATDLDGAVAIAGALASGLPQVDRRIVVLSDLADGSRTDAPLGEGSRIPVWNALPEIVADGEDCAVVRADRSGVRVRVHLACTPGMGPARAPRGVAVYVGETLLAEAVVAAGETSDLTLTLPNDGPANLDEPGALTVRLRGVDAIASDDTATVVTEAALGNIAIVAESEGETAATGGAPVVEQALAALLLDVDVRPLPEVPDRSEDLGAFVGMILDDPPGLTPEERSAVGAFVGRGGMLLIALGPRAATAPLGASLAPFLDHPVRWEATTARGVDPRSATEPLLDSASSLMDLGAARRAVVHSEDRAAFTSMVDWTDHAPLVMRRAIGRGEVWVVSLPFTLDASEIALRPAFLSLLAGWVEAAQERTVPRRSEVGQPWTFRGAHELRVKGPPSEPAPAVQQAGGLFSTPSRLGLYRLIVDGHDEIRVSAPAAKEVDLRPRRLTPEMARGPVDEGRATVDASPALAALLLLLTTLELLLRSRKGSLDGAQRDVT